MRTLPYALFLLVSLTTTATANIADIVDLGDDATNDLWFHFNANKSDTIELDEHGNVTSWTTVDKDGSTLGSDFDVTTTLTSTVTYDSLNGSLTFNGGTVFSGSIAAPTS